MYEVELCRNARGKPAVVVSDRGRIVGGGSVEFVRWLCGVPKALLRPEQIAITEWMARPQSIG